MKLPWISTADVSEIAIQHSPREESISFIVASQKSSLTLSSCLAQAKAALRKTAGETAVPPEQRQQLYLAWFSEEGKQTQ